MLIQPDDISSVLHYIVQKGYQDLIAFGSALGVQIEDSSS
jgi:hypothetical protein